MAFTCACAIPGPRCPLDGQASSRRLRPRGTGGDDYVLAVLVTYDGDANLDGDVNRDDLLAMKPNFGKSGVTWADGDFDGDGDVDAFNYITLKRNYGRSIGGPPKQPLAPSAAPKAPTTTASGPEPVTSQGDGNAPAPTTEALVAVEASPEAQDSAGETPEAPTTVPLVLAADSGPTDGLAAAPHMEVPVSLAPSFGTVEKPATSSPAAPLGVIDALAHPEVGPQLPPASPRAEGLPTRLTATEPLTFSSIMAAMPRQIGPLPAIWRRSAPGPVRLDELARVLASPLPIRSPSLSSSDLLDLLKPLRLRVNRLGDVMQTSRG